MLEHNEESEPRTIVIAWPLSPSDAVKSRPRRALDS